MIQSSIECLSGRGSGQFVEMLKYEIGFAFLDDSDMRLRDVEGCIYLYLVLVSSDLLRN